MALPNAEKLTSQMAMLPDQALKQMAMMHKNDPYVLPLIISEDGRRKQMRQAAQAQMGGMPQPKVADAAIAGMDAQPVMTGAGVPLQTGYGGRVQTELPEDQGIARIPAPNMQRIADGGIAGYGDDEDLMQRSEPVLRMAGGGIPGYKNGGTTDKQAFAMQYKDLAEKVGQELGVDPGIIISQWGLETAWGKKPVGQYNLGNIKDVTGKGPVAYDKLEKSKASYKSYESPEAFAADYASLIKRNFPKAVGAGSDVGAFTAGLQSGTKGAYATDPNYRKSLASTFNSLPSIIPSAQAGEPPKPAAPDLASQIPGYSPARSLAPGEKYDVPASTYDQTNSYFGKLADKMGIPLEYQRNIANTANALSGFTSPINTVNRAVGTASRALEATPEMIANAQRAKQIAETERLLPPAKAGLEALDEASQAARAAAEAARRARGVEQDVQAAKAAEQSIDAANMTSKIARTTEEAVAAGPNARALDAAKTANAAKALATTQLAEEKVKGLFPEATRPEVGESVSGNYDKAPPPAEVPKPSDVLEATKEAVPAKERKGFGNDDLLMLGLSLLANKSPNFMTALGEAGIQTLGAKKEREKAETDLEYKDIMKKYYGALGTKAEADAKNLEAGTKYNAAARQHAMDNISREMQKWYSTLGGMNPTPQEEETKRNSLVRQYFPLAGLEVPSTISAPAPSAGFKVLGSRPQ